MASKKAPSKSVAKRVEIQKKPVVHRKPKAAVGDVVPAVEDVVPAAVLGRSSVTTAPTTKRAKNAK